MDEKVEITRTSKSIKNVSYGIIGIMVNLILVFIVRTFFIRTLGTTYLGLNGLISNILSMLSLVELGIGSAMVFKLYKPLADKNKTRVKTLMYFYKKMYRIISIIILVGSLILLPFIEKIVNYDSSFVNIYVVFILYALQTVSTYMFFAYKSSLLQADQREYVIVRYSTIVDIISSILQIIVLINFQSYYSYLLIYIITSIVKNILVSIKVNKDYPYLNDGTEQEKLSVNEIKMLFMDFGALFLYRINFVVINATNNLIINAYIGLDVVGIYSNYLLITLSLRKLINSVFQSIKSSIGNLYAEKGKSEVYRVFKVLNLVAFYLYGGAAIGIFILTRSFITLWIGEDFTLDIVFSLLIAVEFYISGIRTFLSQFRNSLGLFQQAKYRPVIEIILNIIITLILVNYLGINGIILGTILSAVLTMYWFDPIIIHKYGFEKNSIRYFIKNTYYVVVVFTTGFFIYNITSLVMVNNFYNLAIHFIISLTLILVTFTLTIVWMPEFKGVLVYLKRFLKKGS